MRQDALELSFKKLVVKSSRQEPSLGAKLLWWCGDLLIIKVQALLSVSTKMSPSPEYIDRSYRCCRVLVVCGAMQLTLQSVWPWRLQMAIENRPKLALTTVMMPWSPGPSLSSQDMVMFSPSHL